MKHRPGTKFVCRLPKRFQSISTRIFKYDKDTLIMTNPECEPVRLNRITKRWNKLKLPYAHFLGMHKGRIVELI